MIGLTVDAGDHFKKRVAIPLAPCMCSDQGPNIYKDTKPLKVDGNEKLGGPKRRQQLNFSPACGDQGLF